MLYIPATTSALDDPSSPSYLDRLYTNLLSLRLSSRPLTPPHQQRRWQIHPEPPTTMSSSPFSATSPTSSSAVDEPSSPGFPPIPHGNLTSKGIDTTNTTYTLSFERTRIPDLPFPHPKWHIRPSSGHIYETTSPILEEYDPVTGYVDSVGTTVESVERDEKNAYGGEIGKGEMGWLEGVGGVNGWTGRVEWPVSGERSSIVREAKRAREESQGGMGNGDGLVDGASVRRSKRVRQAR